MGLRFIIGASGAGKSETIFNEIMQRAREDIHTNFLAIVPDQFTMQTQKDLCRMSPTGGIMNIDVLSFGRLAHRVFEEVGGDSKEVLDDTGKSLILCRVASQVEGNLSALSTNIKKMGYIHEVKSVISEFMQYGIGDEEIDKLMEYSHKKEALRYKLEDLKILYHAFLDFTKEKYITTEEILDVVKKKLPQSELIKNSVIVFDGFTGFTPVQNALVQELMCQSKEVIVTVTLDEKINPYVLAEEQDLFYMSTKTIVTLENLAKEAGVPRGKDIILQGHPVKRYEKKKELAHLEENIFRYKNNPYLGGQESVTIWEAKNPLEEVGLVACKIKNLIQDCDYKYSDIAVVTGDLNGYAHLFEAQFRKSGIPFFLDFAQGILLNPFIEYIKSALETVIHGYSYETVFHFLRSGMTDIDRSAVDRLENYVIALGIHGSRKWKEPFYRATKDCGEGDELVANLEELNKIRLNLLSLLAPFDEKPDTGESISKAMYQFIVISRLEEKLIKRKEEFEKSGDLVRAKEYGQIYRLVMELLEKIVLLLPDEKMTLKEYTAILYAGFDEIQVGTLPQNVDQVVIGDIERSRLKPIKMLFFVGVNDGIIPKNNGTGGLIADIDREFLEQSCIELAPTPRQKMYTQRFYLYLNMTKPTEGLSLSFVKKDREGNTVRPAYLVSMVKSLYLEMKIVGEELVKQPGMDYFIYLLREYAKGNLKEESNRLISFYKYYQKDEANAEMLQRLLYAAFYQYEHSKLAQEIAEALYGKTLKNSVSRLESYAACAYKHFLTYGLCLEEREQYTFENVDLGKVFHGVLERFASILDKNQTTWFDFTEKQGEEWVYEALSEYSAEYGSAILYYSARNEYMITRMQRILEKTVKSLQYQLKKGIFSPSGFEVSFTSHFDLNENAEGMTDEELADEKAKMDIRGRIDRIDTYEDEKKVYVKIIDYKSGNKDFDILAFYYGLQLQLVVYMDAAIRLEKKKHANKEIIPAGMFYYHVDDPCIAVSDANMSDEAIEGEIRKMLRMKGLVNADSSVVAMMDTSMNSSSDVIPVGYKKGGEYTKASSVMEQESMAVLSQFVNHKINQIGKEIIDGNIEVNPYEMGERSACTYCAYHSVCGFDKKIPGYQYRKLEGIPKDEVFGKILEEINEETNEDANEETNEETDI